MDNGDWICLQCGRYAYVGLYGRSESPVDSRLPLPAAPVAETPAPRRYRHRAGLQRAVRVWP